MKRCNGRNMKKCTLRRGMKGLIAKCLGREGQRDRAREIKNSLVLQSLSSQDVIYPEFEDGVSTVAWESSS